ncbi:AbrB/MazE/SpoVT family DNA-binding domain-containing protein [Pseudonocardia sp. DLS-67]
MRTTIDGAGRVVIPKQLRQAASLEPGQELEITERDGRIEIEPLSAPVQLVERGASSPRKSRTSTSRL